MFRTKSAVRNWIHTLEEIRFLVRLRVVGSRTLGILWVYFRIYIRYVTIDGGLPKENFPVSLQWLNLQYSCFSPDSLLLKRRNYILSSLKNGENINRLKKIMTFHCIPFVQSMCQKPTTPEYSLLTFPRPQVCECVCVCVCVCVREREREREK